MQTIAVISQKGGPGKTMLATHLAVAAERAGHTVALLDTDQQCSAINWFDQREGNTPATIATPTQRLAHWLSVSESNGATLAIVDTAPNIGHEALTVARLVSFILIPSRAAKVDIEAIPPSLDIAKIAKKPAHIVLNAIDPRSNMGAKGLRTIQQLGVPCVPFMIGDRVGFVRAFNNGATVNEFEPNSKSAREITRLYNYIEKEMQTDE